MDSIARLDISAFHMINGQLTSSILDVFMPFITDKTNFVWLAVAAVVLMTSLGTRKDRWTIVLLALLVATSDLSASLVKEVFARVRPCHALDGVRLLSGCGSSYSFPSSHATNIFAAGVFLSARYKRYAPAFLLVAFAVAYSRVYVGVHYPADVLAGAVLGTALACAFYGGEALIRRVYLERTAGAGD